MTDANIEKRLEAARKARADRLAEGGPITTGDAILNALDALPDVSSQVAQLQFWLVQRLKAGDMLGGMRKEAALYWVNGPRKK